MQRTLYPNNDRMMNDVSFNVNSTASVSVSASVSTTTSSSTRPTSAPSTRTNLKESADYHQTLATATKIAAVGNGLLATQDPNEKATILQKSAQEVGTLVQNARLNPKGADLFTRTNQVFGISAEFRF